MLVIPTEQKGVKSLQINFLKKLIQTGGLTGREEGGEPCFDFVPGRA